MRSATRRLPPRSGPLGFSAGRYAISPNGTPGIDRSQPRPTAALTTRAVGERCLLFLAACTRKGVARCWKPGAVLAGSAPERLWMAW